MKNMLVVGLVALSALNGCIYYEGGGATWDGDGDGDWEDWGDWNDDDDDYDDDDDDAAGDAPEDDGYTCYPDEADPGDTLIVDVIADDGSSLGECGDVSVFGDCALLTWEVDGDQLTLVVTIDAEATGSCDVLVEFGDGTVDFIEDAIDITGDESTDDDHEEPADGMDDDCP